MISKWLTKKRPGEVVERGGEGELIGGCLILTLYDKQSMTRPSQALTLPRI